MRKNIFSIGSIARTFGVIPRPKAGGFSGVMRSLAALGMTKKAWLLALLFFSASGASWAGGSESSAPAWSMPEKEIMTFRVKWLGVTAGSITAEIKGIELVRGRKAYRIEVAAKTTGLAAKLYKVDDRFVSFLDVEKLHTLRQEVHRSEGSYHKDAVTDFDQVAHKAYFKNQKNGQGRTFAIPPDVQDSVTAVYFLRTVVLKKGDVQTVRVCMNERNFTVQYKVANQQTIAVPGQGRKEALLVKSFRQLGKKKPREGRMSGFISSAMGHEPYQFFIKAPVFTSVTAVRVK